MEVTGRDLIGLVAKAGSLDDTKVYAFKWMSNVENETAQAESDFRNEVKFLDLLRHNSGAVGYHGTIDNPNGNSIIIDFFEGKDLE